MNMQKVGPVGGYGARKLSTIWSEKGRDQVAGFRITYGKHSVYSLLFMYYENARLVLSDRHGDCDDDEKRNYVPVVFDYPSEYLTSISCSVKHGPLLMFMASIKFGTHKGSYGPFGSPSTDGNDIDFDLLIGNRRLFGGFHGSENCYGVGSIGVYLKTESNDQEGSSSNKASKMTKIY
ncbi:inactive protein RESTRICTED TEV MOVEMENT 1-like [Nicotiana tabacum]|uniref:Inactive protein RESTRICTED TEV MOVEMENT 1-like n=2 Tax=Nicotiana TaxID=4085 RepID=A0A1S3ZH86_TOBAC|nr:PREDICTED: inactive protein RESTRICTED TEV MOVEMENT 1-like [Nicotiana sylvestris]XP_016463617.1 PREDICTED: inactive protein RESTRICTED TEV MOVEMENT 1-like [Nicotiana tabacum]